MTTLVIDVDILVQCDTLPWLWSIQSLLLLVHDKFVFWFVITANKTHHMSYMSRARQALHAMLLLKQRYNQCLKCYPLYSIDSLQIIVITPQTNAALNAILVYRMTFILKENASNLEWREQNIVDNPRLILFRYSPLITRVSTDGEILVAMNYTSVILKYLD